MKMNEFHSRFVRRTGENTGTQTIFLGSVIKFHPFLDLLIVSFSFNLTQFLVSEFYSIPRTLN